MKKILVLGSTGLLGSALVLKLKKKYKIFCNINKKKIFFEGVEYCSLVNEFQKIDKLKLVNYIKKNNIEIIINCIAITNIDSCEKHPNKSFKVNFQIVETLSEVCSEINIKLIQISTDQIFKINKNFKNEKDKTFPLNIYGKHKLMAEDIVVKNCKNYIIIRTNFFGHDPKKSKFTDKILENSTTQKINLYSNYFFSPIYTGELSKIIGKAIQYKINGLYNICGNEKISKYDFGKQLEKYSTKKLTLNKKKLVNNTNKLENARRNFNLSISNNKIKKDLKIKIPSFNKQVKQFFIDRDKTLSILNHKIYYGRHSISENDIQNVTNTLKYKALTQGSKISEVEKQIANYVGSKYCVLVSSATAGLHISYQAAGLKTNSSFITSPITFLSTGNAGLLLGAKPHFLDINPETLNIDENLILDEIKKTNKIDAIVPVHFGGMPVNLKKIYNKTKSKNIKIIEDAAHAFGSKYDCGSRVGSCKYSDMCVFSFHPVKIIAGGEGGAVTTNSKNLYEKLIALRSHGIGNQNQFKNTKYGYTNNKKNPWFYEMRLLGYHYRQTDIHASLIESQLKRVEIFLKKRSSIAKSYDNFFKKKKNIYITQSNFRKLSAKHLYILKFNFKNLKINRQELILKLRNCGIFTQVHYIPLVIQEFYKKLGYNTRNLDNAMEYYENCLSIPIYFDLTNEQRKYVENTIVQIVSDNIG